ncbi:MAG TPA: rhodanese-like domain-containing protein [Rhodocyclaceae bacterium]|jgi:rhodanese-related sulfurtransferase|nr:rhodanese-like domain-containing protein [Rhodocyclaceae bacterium]HMW76906.1 rhodanese-like domain-containing protein [Rhodocyclaceae bacterium]HNE43567.1 rhodanese-like domain-containing protein [Rhodocyclaceae bacterium]HNL20991.1 rhodanese-like domain-containing protein [Rhodocyclaceae bacterium]HNM21143.1 rhodanese-like domain-containing protein [Rhodocyclaceae bacterium]
MAITKGCQQLIAEARERIRTLSLAEARAKFDDRQAVFVDIRDIRELEREGMIPGAFHAPRGMLEFWVDPESPYYKEIFGSGKEFVLYCQSAWRSSLATAALQDMGLAPVAQIEGGFKAWKAAGHPVAERATHKP